MKQFFVVLLAVSAVYGQSPALRAAGTGPTQPLPTLVCSSGTYGPDARLGRSLGPCKDPQVYGEEPGKIHPNCAMFCMNKAFGLLDSKTNLPTLEIYDTWINTKIPAEHRSLASSHFKECFERFGSKIDLNDPTCKMAGAYNTCNWKIQPKLVC